MKLVRGQIAEVQFSEMPESFRENISYYADKFQNLGFTLSHYEKEDPYYAGINPDWRAVYLNAQEKTYACATFNGLQTTDDILQVVFHTYTTGRTFATYLHLEPIGCTKLSEIQNSCAPEIADQYKMHIEFISNVKNTMIRSGPQDYISKRNSERNQYLDISVAEGYFSQDAQGNMSVSLYGSFKAAIRAALNYNKLKKLTLDRQKLVKQVTSNTAKPLDVEEQVKRFQEIKEMRERPTLKPSNKVILFLISLGLFALSFSQGSNYLSLIFLCATILFHELGHVFGMWLFGYKSLNILFLPFLGAIATGKRKETRFHQEIIILLLGPLPGIILGGILYQFFLPGEPLRELAAIMIFINFANLLPIMPFDGGQVVNLILGNMPYVSFFFRLVGFSLMAFIGFYGDFKILGAIGLFLAISSISNFSVHRLQIKIYKAVRKRIKYLRIPEKQILKEIFNEAGDKLLVLEANQRYEVVTELLKTLQQSFPRLSTRAAWAVVYACSLGSPLIPIIPTLFTKSYATQIEEYKVIAEKGACLSTVSAGEHLMQNLELYSLPPSDISMLTNSLARCQVELGRYEEASQTYNKVAMSLFACVNAYLLHQDEKDVLSQCRIVKNRIKLSHARILKTWPKEKRNKEVYRSAVRNHKFFMQKRPRDHARKSKQR